MICLNFIHHFIHHYIKVISKFIIWYDNVEETNSFKPILIYYYSKAEQPDGNVLFFAFMLHFPRLLIEQCNERYVNVPNFWVYFPIKNLHVSYLDQQSFIDFILSKTLTQLTVQMEYLVNIEN